ncbi:hypothetical protein PV05_07202 [Exophiala xenobiotica]|uniref:Uncharacterized protein n=1 Tax=Exophiala xenobiotica TaxID=348802 RepID=A0A0D2BQR7_9EURO|nr:uncharacterized protein PV05_07202 [Exophiala xenobiotica]KIW54871.1 hypothetical protein PV05_07202 [Exophiala xenobiotica]
MCECFCGLGGRARRASSAVVREIGRGVRPVNPAKIMVPGQHRKYSLPWNRAAPFPGGYQIGEPTPRRRSFRPSGWQGTRRESDAWTDRGSLDRRGTQEQEVEFEEHHEEFEDADFEESEFFVEADGEARGHLSGRRESEQQAGGDEMGQREREESVQGGGIEINHRGREESFGGMEGDHSQQETHESIGGGGTDHSQRERYESIEGGGTDPSQQERSGSLGQGANDAGESDENEGGHGGGRQSRLNSEGFGGAL